MTEEDEEFQRLEREAKMRALEDDDIQDYKKPWVGLTDEEVLSIVHYSQFNNARAIEAKLREKNT